MFIGRKFFACREACSLTLFFLWSCKLWTYAGLRFVYPMSQYLANDWNITADEMSMVLAAGEFVPAGFFGSLVDIFGPWILSLCSFAFLSIISWLILVPPIFPVLMILRFCSGFGVFMFLVAAQTSATIGVSPEKTDFITGMLETSYSLSALLIVPLLSVVYDNLGWRAPFFMLAIAVSVHIPLMVIVFRSSTVRALKDHLHLKDKVDEDERIEDPTTMLPGSEEDFRDVSSVTSSDNEGDSSEENTEKQQAESNVDNNGKRLGLRAGFVWRTGALVYNLSGFFLSAGLNLLATEIGFLLHSYFNLSEEDAGTASVALGLAEFVGVTLTTINFGQSFLAMESSGLLLASTSLIYVFVATTSLGACLSSLFFVFLLGEYSTVVRLSRAPLFANQQDNASMLGSQVQFQVIGRTVGAAIGAQLFYGTSSDMNIGHYWCSGMTSGFYFLMIITLRVSLHQRAKYLALVAV